MVPLRLSAFLGLVILNASACEGPKSAPTSGAHDRPETADATANKRAAPELDAPKASCGGAAPVETLAPGLTLETLEPTIAPAVPVADPCLRVLRADPERFEVQLGAAAEEPRTGPEWAELRGAVAVVNASMYRPDGGSTGLLVDGDRVLTGTVNQQFGAFFAAGPRRDGLAPLTMWGEGCPGSSVDALRRDYRLVVQNYRLLDCEGEAIAWKDEKLYSVAAVGLDNQGRVLFIHSRAPYRMAEFTKLLRDPALGLELEAAMYVEGGPEATLALRTPAREAVFVGSFETQFTEHDDNRAPWALPNVLLLVPREAKPHPAQPRAATQNSPAG